MGPRSALATVLSSGFADYDYKNFHLPTCLTGLRGIIPLRCPKEIRFTGDVCRTRFDSLDRR